jgi:DNA-binding response OmpR family regulator
MPPPSGTTRVPVVAVVNTSQEITNLLEVLFQIEGFQVVTAFTLDIKEGRFDFDQLVRDHQPDAVVWDIAIPYEANWALFEQIAASPAGQRCRFILTTTNKLALRSLVGEVAVHELIGKPFDLDEIVGAVRRAMGDDLATQDSEGDHPSPDRTA